MHHGHHLQKVIFFYIYLSMKTRRIKHIARGSLYISNELYKENEETKQQREKETKQRPPGYFPPKWLLKLLLKHSPLLLWLSPSNFKNKQPLLPFSPLTKKETNLLSFWNLDSPKKKTKILASPTLFFEESCPLSYSLLSLAFSLNK